MAGNALTVLTLASFLFALGAAVVGRMADEPVLFVVAVTLALTGLVLSGVLVVLQRRGAATASGPPKGIGPKERLKAMDDLFYPSADPRRELGEECRAFAVKVRVTVEWYEAERISNIARVAGEAVEADPDLDMEQAYKDARSLIERNLEARYALELRDEGLRLFDQAREQENAILAKYRREVDHPNAFALEEVANIFRTIARRLDVDVSEPAPIPKARYLAESIDELIREGIALRKEMAEPVKPQETKPGNWLIEGGVPEGWWEKVDDFSARAWNLLHAERPALLSTHGEGHNSYIRKERKRGEEDAERPSGPDTRTEPQKVLEFFNATRSGPSEHMDALLEGLAAARRQLGSETGA